MRWKGLVEGYEFIVVRFSIRVEATPKASPSRLGGSGGDSYNLEARSAVREDLELLWLIVVEKSYWKA